MKRYYHETCSLCRIRIQDIELSGNIFQNTYVDSDGPMRSYLTIEIAYLKTYRYTVTILECAAFVLYYEVVYTKNN